MSVISFEEWKKKHEKRNGRARKARPNGNTSLRESYGFDLCNFITEDSNAFGFGADYDYVLTLLNDLDELIEETEGSNACFYFKAYRAFREQNETLFFDNFKQYLQKEREDAAVVKEPLWWVEHFLWTFLPPYTGFYSSCASLLFEYYPDSAMPYICEALELSESEGENAELILEALHTAKRLEPDNFLCDYLIASLYFEQHQWRNALIYFRHAERAEIYRNDPTFLFDCGWAAEKCDELALAEDYYRRSSEIDESQPCALNNLGCLKMRQGKNEEAYKVFLHAIALDIDGVLPYKNALSALERQSKYDEALSFLDAKKAQFGPYYIKEKARFSLLQKSKSFLQDETINYLPDSGGFAQESVVQKRRLSEMLANVLRQGGELWGRRFSIYEDEQGYGCQYYLLGAGLLDLLLIDEEDGSLNLVLCCGGYAGETELLRLLHQADILSKTLLKPEQKMKATLLCRELSPSAKQLSEEQKLFDLQIMSFDFSFTKL